MASLARRLESPVPPLAAAAAAALRDLMERNVERGYVMASRGRALT